MGSRLRIGVLNVLHTLLHSLRSAGSHSKRSASSLQTTTIEELQLYFTVDKIKLLWGFYICNENILCGDGHGVETVSPEKSPLPPLLRMITALFEGGLVVGSTDLLSAVANEMMTSYSSRLNGDTHDAQLYLEEYTLFVNMLRAMPGCEVRGR